VSNKTISIIAVSVLVLAGIIGFTGLQKAKIDAARAIQTQQIEQQRAVELGNINREKEIAVQKAKVERTEERSQFWQKLVPWGQDEQEENK
jgi:hypothetical protein